MAKSERMVIRRHEILVDVADRTFEILKRFGLNDDDAQAAADCVVDDLSDNWGGQCITVPRDMNYRNAKRRQAIVDGFNGFNHSELAKEFGLTTNAVYKILRRAQGK